MILLVAAVFATTTTRLVLCGDIMLNGIEPSPRVFAGITAQTTASDLTLANLEVPLTNASTKTARKPLAEVLQHNQFILKANPRHAPFIAAAGIGMVCLANNHAMDYGPAGLGQMLAALDQAKIAHAGAGLNSNAALRPTVVTVKNGVRVALLSALGFVTRSALLKTTPATLQSPGISVLSFGGRIDEKTRGKLKAWVDKARAKADLVIVAMHWGIERKPLPTPYQVSLGRALIDAGADIVWGAHPHVLEGAELYKGHLILYSTGNLISNLPAETGLFQVRIQADGSQHVQFVPARNKGGRILLKSGPQRLAGIRAMQGLCRLLLRRYPSAVSVPAL